MVEVAAVTEKVYPPTVRLRTTTLPDDWPASESLISTVVLLGANRVTFSDAKASEATIELASRAKTKVILRIGCCSKRSETERL